MCFSLHCFYTVFTHTVTFSFIKSKYSCTPNDFVLGNWWLSAAYAGIWWRGVSTFLSFPPLSFLLPLPFPIPPLSYPLFCFPSLPLPLEVVPLKSASESGYRCKLLRWGPGRSCPSTLTARHDLLYKSSNRVRPTIFSGTPKCLRNCHKSACHKLSDVCLKSIKLLHTFSFPLKKLLWRTVTWIWMGLYTTSCQAGEAKSQ